jgi:rhodanese-related sulfurtransferase
MMPANRSGAGARAAVLPTGPATLPGLLQAGVARDAAPARPSGPLRAPACALAAVKAEPIWLLAACIAAGCALVMALAEAITVVVATPPLLAGVTVVNAQQGRKLMEQGAPMIDTRPTRHYQREHVSGAVSIPYEDQSGNDVAFDRGQDNFDLAQLPADKAAPLVFYCNAAVCWTSYKAAKVAADAGYVHVHWLRGGLAEWRTNGFSITTHDGRRGPST